VCKAVIARLVLGGFEGFQPASVRTTCAKLRALADSYASPRRPC
jgi:hypothetical protein